MSDKKQGARQQKVVFEYLEALLFEDELELPVASSDQENNTQEKKSGSNVVECQNIENTLEPEPEPEPETEPELEQESGLKLA